MCDLTILFPTQFYQRIVFNSLNLFFSLRQQNDCVSFLVQLEQWILCGVWLFCCAYYSVLSLVTRRFALASSYLYGKLLFNYSET